MPTAPADPEPPPRVPAPRAHRLRGAIAVLLIVVASLTAPFAFVAVWTHRTIYSDDGYVDAVTPLARQQSIQDAVAQKVSSFVESYLTSADVASKLPSALQPATAVGRRALEALVGKETVAALQSEAFQSFWKRANRAIHDQVVKWMTDNGTDIRFRIQGDKVQIDLTPVVQQVEARLAKSGIPIVSDVKLRGLKPTYTIFQGSVASSVQRGLRALNTLAVVLPPFALVAYAAAVACATRRRNTLMWSGLGFALGTAAGLLAMWIGHQYFLDVVRGSGISTAAASDAYRILLRGLRLQLWIGFAIGVVIALGARIAGATRPATRLRALHREGLHRTRSGSVHALEG
ncbi:MAG: integral rane protein [Actinomycetia bacterium]|nr:integral rane protein [Actinomycetes bacterium]